MELDKTTKDQLVWLCKHAKLKPEEVLKNAVGLYYHEVSNFIHPEDYPS